MVRWLGNFIAQFFRGVPSRYVFVMTSGDARHEAHLNTFAELVEWERLFSGEPAPKQFTPPPGLKLVRADLITLTLKEAAAYGVVDADAKAAGGYRFRPIPLTPTTDELLDGCRAAEQLLADVRATEEADATVKMPITEDGNFIDGVPSVADFRRWLGMDTLAGHPKKFRKVSRSGPWIEKMVLINNQRFSLCFPDIDLKDSDPDAYEAWLNRRTRIAAEKAATARWGEGSISWQSAIGEFGWSQLNADKAKCAALGRE